MLFSVCKGNIDSPPICFLHGFMGSHKDFFPIIEHLEDFFCVTIDLTPDSFPILLDKIKKRILTLGFSKVHLVGYSLGGRLALLFAKAFPKLVEQLSILSASPGISPAEIPARLEKDEHWAFILENWGLDYFIERWYDQPLFKGLKEKELFQQMIANRKNNDLASLAWVLRHLSIAKQPSLWEDLSHFPMPTHFLFGEYDIKYLSLQKRLEAKHMQVHVVPDSSHAIHLENPLFCAKQIGGLCR